MNGWLLTLMLGVLLLATLWLYVPLRRALISRPLLNLFKTRVSPMSATEKEAIAAGTVWWDAELFSGKPDWHRLQAVPAPQLNPEEQLFLDQEVEQLCDLANDWETTAVWQDISPRTWKFIKDAGFMGLTIPKQYGGKGFSAYMHSQVIMKLSSRCSAAAITVMVPNSLGPAELLLHYGTEAQKKYYLPRLAHAEEIPCFALTSPYAGSDAAAMPDVGVVCKGLHEGREVLGFRLTWNKRYITLAPIATVLGLAFHAMDPDKLLGERTDLGITCALIPTQHPGVQIGRRHWPLNAVFQNGPTSGKDVFIPMEWVIGGRVQIGKGWQMVMECLSAGRALSLPAASVGIAKLAARSTSAYTALRRQFHVSIGTFEGVQEALAPMGGHLYMMDAMRRLAASAVDLGEKPSVLSAVTKYHLTERARTVVNHAMDIAGGKGICIGPNNQLAHAYQNLPIAITVEGANILTRSLMIFGQGAIRCHPALWEELQAASEPHPRTALRRFDAALVRHLGFFLGNLGRSLLYGLSRGLAVPAPAAASDATRGYYRAVNHLSANFALLADVSILLLGAKLKQRERLSARLGDVLSQLLLVSATLKRYQDEGRQAEDLPYLHWAVQDALHQAQRAFDGVLQNYPNRALAILLRLVTRPFGMAYRQPDDAASSAVAQAMQMPSASRDRLFNGCYVPRIHVDPVGYDELALQLLPQVEKIHRRLRSAVQGGALPPMPEQLPDIPKWAERAYLAGLVNGEEKRLLTQFARDCDRVLKVDDFPADFHLMANLEKRLEVWQHDLRMAA